MGFADGFYYGQGKIIVDTTNLLATDVVRVRSMTAPTKVWNKTVTTPGDYAVFEVPGKDYYKISKIQEISGEEADVANVRRTIGYGEVVVIGELGGPSLGTIQAILDAHEESTMLNIGDEITIKVSGEDAVLQIADIDLYESHEAILMCKDIWVKSPMSTGSSAANYTVLTTLHGVLDSFYNGMTDADRALVKSMERSSRNSDASTYTTYSAYVWNPSYAEIGNRRETYSSGRQFHIFTDNASRVKRYNGVATPWRATDFAGSGGWGLNMGDGTDGASTSTWANMYPNVSHGIVPAFHLTSDV